MKNIMENYNPLKIEKKWAKKWDKENRWQVDINKAKKPYFNLMMFPYPSAEGLHIGNLYAFIGSDIHGRYMRLRGYDVFEPMGFDAFGIHSENFAIRENTHPRELIKKSTDNFRRQLKQTGNMYSWDQEVNTTDPAYYKWTQWLFLQLYKAGLAYRKEAPVSWCPSCKTVLANEQVIAGKCERCDSLVETKKLKQWFLKITDYSERLLENLKTIDWSERTKIAQTNWIGKSQGYRIRFSIESANGKSQMANHFVEVFTTRPDTLYGATYVVLAPEHELVEKLKERIENWEEVVLYIEKSKKQGVAERTRDDKEKTGVALEGIRAVNPVNKEEVPVWIADYVLAEYGTGAIMAVPAHDQRDFAFAQKYNLQIRQVIEPVSSEDSPNSKFKIPNSGLTEAYEGGGVMINSGKFDGMKSEEAREAIGEYAEGDSETHFHLRDWLISRQRYWGPPIPMIYCDKCGTVPVPEEDLPVELPHVEDFKPTGTDKSPLATVEEFVKVKCPQCKGDAQRETDVSDTFLDSAWYYLRYPSVGIDGEPWDRALTKKWLPVDMYIGGQEHAVLHLMYVRFITMFLHDQKLIDFEEPFKKFRAHGLLIKEGAKISKSRGNIVVPDEYFDAWGVDTVRMYLMFLSPLEDGGDWHDEGIRGVHRFLGRVWGLVQKSQIANGESQIADENLQRIKHKTIKRVTEDVERLHYNTAISAMMEYLNELVNSKWQIANGHIQTLLILLAPFAPHITEELWERLDEKGSVHDQQWPDFDPKLIIDEKIEVPIQVNGKLRAKIEVEADISEKELEKAALANEKIKKLLDGKEPKKVIVVSGRLVNVVV